MRLLTYTCSILAGGLLSAAMLVSPALAGELPSAPSQGARSSQVSEIIVAFQADVSQEDRAGLRSGAGVARVRGLRLRDTELVRATSGAMTAALSALSRSPQVRYAEPNGLVRAQSADTYWPLLWGLQNTGQLINGLGGLLDADADVPEAWTRSLGTGQTVAIVDSGITFNHRDLQGQFAVNPGESGSGRETNGIDDDSDGLVDDFRGWDFVEGDNLPGDADGHGTHVAGTIAARKDNETGVVGAAPSAKVMSLRVLDATGSGTTAAVSQACDLAGDQRIKIVNASLSGGYSRAVQEAIASHPDTLYVVAAGNGSTDGIGDDNDLTPTYPCALAQANIVCVGASDSSDRRAPFSNYGLLSVDLLAPGVNILSTWIDDPVNGCASSCYVYSSGTSMAAPHVAAALALMRAANPALTSTALKTLLLSGVDPKLAFAATAVSGGRLNAATAVSAAAALLVAGTDTTAPQTTIDGGPAGTINSTTVSFDFSASEPGSVFECRLDGPGATTAARYDACSSPKQFSGLSDGGYSLSVRARDAAGNTDATPATRAFTVATAVVVPVAVAPTSDPVASTPALTSAPTTPDAVAIPATTPPVSTGEALSPGSPAAVFNAAPLRAPTLTIPTSARRIVPIAKGIITVRLNPPKTSGTGTITLTSGKQHLGARRFLFAASQRLTVRIRLSPAGRRLLRRTRTIRVNATIRATGTTGLTRTRTVILMLTLR